MNQYGYKQTEIGVIPEDWTVDTIDSVTLSVATGGNYKNSIQRSPYPLIKMGNLSRGHVNLNKIEYVIDSIPSEKDRLAYGDVLFNTRNTPELVGKVAVWKNELPIAYFNSNLLRFNFDLEKTNPFFMNLIFNTEQVISEFKNIAKGTTSVAAIYPQDMLKVKIKIPPIQEQNHIAEALSDVDSMISSLEKLIAKKKAVKQGAMQELLTGKKRLSRFTEDWEDYTIGKMGEFYSGLSGKSKKDFDCGEAYYITFLNVLSNVKIDTSILASVDVRENESQNAVRKGDLFFNTSSETPEEVGMCAVLDEELVNTYLNSFCFGFRLFDDTHNPLFLSYYFNSAIGRKIMGVLAQGATRYNLSKNNFAETVIKLPVKEEQTAIASILSDMDVEIEALEQKLKKTRQIKQGMMQQLLTGKIRLIDDATNASAPDDSGKILTPKTQTNHNHQFDDAVMIAAVVNSFYSPKYRLGRKKVQKLLYLLRRKQEADTSAFKKKAAGPYADEVRYKGGEPIAKHNGYIETKKNNKGTLFFIGPKMASALEYIAKWQMQDSMDWLVKTFKYIGVEELELLATVDMAMCDLVHAGIEVSVDSIKQLIRSNEEWKAKLKKVTFSDDAIARAIEKCRELFGY